MVPHATPPWQPGQVGGAPYCILQPLSPWPPPTGSRTPTSLSVTDNVVFIRIKCQVVIFILSGCLNVCASASIRGCPYITSAAITRQGHSECLWTLTLGSKGSFKSSCLMKIQSNPHFVWHQKCEISIKIPLLRAKKCHISISSPNIQNWNKVYWKKIVVLASGSFI